MQHEMRRKRQELPREEAERMLREATHGVLALYDGECPYGVPLTHAYVDGRLVFHCAPEGHKLQAMRAYPMASYTVVEQDLVIPEAYTTAYKSAIAFGRLRELEGDEKVQALRQLGHRFRPGFDDELEEEIAPRLHRMVVFVLEVERLTGKLGKELLAQG